jgi:hypothetical protein
VCCFFFVKRLASRFLSARAPKVARVAIANIPIAGRKIGAILSRADVGTPAWKDAGTADVARRIISPRSTSNTSTPSSRLLRPFAQALRRCGTKLAHAQPHMAGASGMKDIELTPARGGVPFACGATWDGKGTNFALFSAHATKVELCLFDQDGKTEQRRVELPEFTNQIWHGYLRDVGPGAVRE